MKTSIIILISIFFIFPQIVLGQKTNGVIIDSLPPDEMYVSRAFTVILSTKKYDSALKVAKEASKKLGLEYKTRGNYPSEQGGLTSDDVCGCGLKHGYIERGRNDDGQYISIEYSSNYVSFADGYYIVIVSSGDRKDLVQQLPKVKDHYHDAYIKNEMVYFGCMH